ncbi:hypothetical protein FP2506_02260 [Fulvimarina pelagi HTCC2506]|uniref:Uncharacterized protein n=1 Tax=Fulvimarina pelagi HTCC2506 TaxID=314231 RepID=Q0FYG8_9HYPH|nr:hypothetical protein FP2506_02260 [Fulvimarina pelagi HTCC2506]
MACRSGLAIAGGGSATLRRARLHQTELADLPFWPFDNDMIDAAKGGG